MTLTALDRAWFQQLQYCQAESEAWKYQCREFATEKKTAGEDMDFMFRRQVSQDYVFSWNTIFEGIGHLPCFFGIQSRRAPPITNFTITNVI